MLSDDELDIFLFTTRHPNENGIEIDLSLLYIYVCVSIIFPGCNYSSMALLQQWFN